MWMTWHTLTSFSKSRAPLQSWRVRRMQPQHKDDRAIHLLGSLVTKLSPLRIPKEHCNPNQPEINPQDPKDSLVPAIPRLLWPGRG